ncbi:MAG: Catalase, partial [Ramlibacter sp.]|nr:Catalase [Ramlibacter sp.]
MPKSTKPANGRADPAKSRTAAKSASRNTDSGPARIRPGPAGDLPAEKMAQTQELASALPFNANKPLEHGAKNGMSPPAGQTAQPASRLPTASTLSEDNGSAKTGSVAPEGVNATIEPLDRVRVDSSGRMLTTNQGVAVADNQNSLKAGVRGPAL